MNEAEILAMSEADLMKNCIETALLGGWFVHHETDSRKTEPGFPDLELIHVKRRLFAKAECKAEKGKLTRTKILWRYRGRWSPRPRPGAKAKEFRGQFEYMSALVAAGVPTFLWRPSDWDSGRVERVLLQGDLSEELQWRPDK